MNRNEAIEILERPREEAITVILGLGEKAEKYDRLFGKHSPATPSGMKAPYEKPQIKRRSKKPGRKKGHPGKTRPRPDHIDHHKEHRLDHCPHCQNPVEEPIKFHTRYTEDIPPVQPEVTEHKVYGYWCSGCQKVVYASVADAFAGCQIGLRLVVFTAWLHYLIGVSVNNIVRMLIVISNFKISTGGLTLAWQRLALHLERVYNDMGQRLPKSAALYADETGWRINGITHWLWCFVSAKLCYYLIDKRRGSPVVKEVLGVLFGGILICDFWGAYNKINALAKQRCFYHLFTELVKVDKYNRSAAWRGFRKKLSRLLRDALRLSKNKTEMSSEKFNRLLNRLHLRLDALLSCPEEQKDVKRLMKRLKRHRRELFTFLEYDVSPYNNYAEQQMRKPVLTRKVSQQNRSDKGAATHAILMTLFRTAELQNLNPMETILSLAKKSIESKLSLDDFKQAA